ncbi:MAG: beta-ketoacyl-[acyl-carrier-protein] synthase family protein [Calditrichaceae bacterium]
MQNHVAVTGLGLMTGLGLDLKSSWDGLISGKKVAKRFTLFDPNGLAATFGVELPGEAEELFKENIQTRKRKQMTRANMIAVYTTKMAIEDSGLDLGSLDRERIGMVYGATGTGYAPQSTEVDENRILKNMASAPAAWNSLIYKISGPSFTVTTACSSGAFAIQSAIQLIQSGQCDVAIAGAADSALSYLDVQGFCSLHALSERNDDPPSASRPFDKGRDGFVMAEGGGILVLETMEFAQKRDANIYCTINLPGLGSEAYNIMSPAPGGVGMARAMKASLSNAGLKEGDIDYINAHGTSTTLNDIYETQAIKEVFGDRAYEIPISSTKSMTGHCLSAAAGVEAVICVKSLIENTIPPTINLNEPDPELDLDYVPNTPRTTKLNHVMSNSFAFGGQNGVCIFSRLG